MSNHNFGSGCYDTEDEALIGELVLLSRDTDMALA